MDLFKINQHLVQRVNSRDGIMERQPSQPGSQPLVLLAAHPARHGAAEMDPCQGDRFRRAAVGKEVGVALPSDLHFVVGAAGGAFHAGSHRVMSSNGFHMRRSGSYTRISYSGRTLAAMQDAR